MKEEASNVTPVLHEPYSVVRAIYSALHEGDRSRRSSWRPSRRWLLGGCGATLESRKLAVQRGKRSLRQRRKNMGGYRDGWPSQAEPPVGSSIPFSLWIHTHPWDAYWSATDLSTLAAYSQILDEALVLGHDHMKRARKAEGDCERLGPEQPLSVWTSEPVRAYSEEVETDAR